MFNDKKGTSKMGLLVRYWDKKDKEMKVGFLEGKFLDHATAKEFYENYRSKRKTS